MSDMWLQGRGLKTRNLITCPRCDAKSDQYVPRGIRPQSGYVRAVRTRTNYPHGHKSRGVSTIHCRRCGYKG